MGFEFSEKKVCLNYGISKFDLEREKREEMWSEDGFRIFWKNGRQKKGTNIVSEDEEAKCRWRTWAKYST